MTTRVCLALPTNRDCAPAIAALAAEAAHGAARFDAQVHVLVLDSCGGPALTAHRATVAELPAAPGVVVHHIDEAAQRAFLAEAVERSGAPEPKLLLDLLLPAGVSYGACTNRAFLLAAALGCSSVHRRDSDSRYQELAGVPVYPIDHELTAIGRRAAEVAPLLSTDRLPPAAAPLPVALVGGSFIGAMSVDLAAIQQADPEVYREIIGLSIPADCPPIWRDHLVRESFRGAGSTAFTHDRTTLTHVSATRVDMCNIALDAGVWGRVPLPPAIDTIGSDYFLIHLVQRAGLPGVLHNRHIVNFHTDERRTGPGFLAYQERLAKYFLAAPYLEALYARLAAADLFTPDGLLDNATVADLVRSVAEVEQTGNAERLDVLDRCYRRLGGPWAQAADALADRRARLLTDTVRDLDDFARLTDAWPALIEAAARTELAG
ncbi:DUF6271 family protein [Kitasatospora sp. NBC_01287]|uniref:DUF6271 family protein n=1 Tax=Kitasatospora sp. NBC_01287 TaxID=2903573 RepID=UPI002251CF3C|nr:DUF6271 family protein [Kitasatospora sp. NBC_01287]MCX4751284.1 DUF6271 family protein [Kitasatospora sp. NBC_01287]